MYFYSILGLGDILLISYEQLIPRLLFIITFRFQGRFTSDILSTFTEPSLDWCYKRELHYYLLHSYPISIPIPYSINPWEGRDLHDKGNRIISLLLVIDCWDRLSYITSCLNNSCNNLCISDRSINYTKGLPLETSFPYHLYSSIPFRQTANNQEIDTGIEGIGLLITYFLLG